MKAGKLILIAVVVAALGAFVGAAGAGKKAAVSGGAVTEAAWTNTERAGGSKVYFTSDISAKSMMAVYKALGAPVSGKVAVKLHMGEPGNENYLRPDLLRDLVLSVRGTFADSNIVYGRNRGNTAGHLQTAKDHGFTYAPVDILDADGEVRLPVKRGKRLKEAILGAHVMNYDWIISVAHFKGHSIAGYGGTFKNLAVGMATPAGKRQLHTDPGGSLFSSTGENFFEKVIEYNMALNDAKPGKLVYINVLNNLSTDCDCVAGAPKASMPDIGILASLDPVALEKASLDCVYARPAAERKDLTDRIESRGGAYQVVYAERMGLGKQAYELIKL